MKYSHSEQNENSLQSNKSRESLRKVADEPIYVVYLMNVEVRFFSKQMIWQHFSLPKVSQLMIFEVLLKPLEWCPSSKFFTF